MELIRKRRDWLIAKAAQAKLATANANALASAHPSSTPTPTPQATNGHYTPGMISASQSPSGSIPLHTPGLHASYFNGGPPPLGNLGNLSGFAGMGNMSNSNSGSGAYTPGSLARMNDGRGPGAGKTADNPSGRCHGCGDQFTTEWRKGPDGAKSLCDACGVSRSVPCRLCGSLADGDSCIMPNYREGGNLNRLLRILPLNHLTLYLFVRVPTFRTVRGADDSSFD